MCRDFNWKYFSQARESTWKQQKEPFLEMKFTQNGSIC